MYIYMYVCVYVCMYVHTHVHTMHTYIYTYIHTCMHTILIHVNYLLACIASLLIDHMTERMPYMYLCIVCKCMLGYY